MELTDRKAKGLFAKIAVLLLLLAVPSATGQIRMQALGGTAADDAAITAHDCTSGAAAADGQKPQDVFAAAQDAGTERQGITDRVIGWYNRHLNYGTVTLLMAVESSFIPFPSEVIVPPAAYQACNANNAALYKTGSKLLNVLLVVLFASLGALAGALLNYGLAVLLGRPVIYWFADSKAGHILLLNGEKIKKAENYFVANGNSSTFIGRLIPGIRQLISIPAGLAKMNIFKFILYTSLGAGTWNVILASLGYLAHGRQDLINKYNEELKVVLWGVFVLFIAYLVFKGLKSSGKRKRAPGDGVNGSADAPAEKGKAAPDK